MPGDFNVNVNLPESSGEVVQEAYRDAIKPAATSTGNILKTVIDAVDAALSPLKVWTLKKNLQTSKAMNLVVEKLSQEDPQLIGPPEPYIAVPALEYLSYSIDNEHLRNLYANLLAKAMYEPTRQDVHPAFLEIIKQLSPIDADLFKFIYELDRKPTITLGSLGDGKKHYNTGIPRVFPDLIPCVKYKYQTQQKSYSNLIRLGLISSESDFPYPDNEYDVIRKTVQYQECKKHLQEHYPDCEAKEYLASIVISPLGHSFYETCVRDSLK